MNYMPLEPPDSMHLQAAQGWLELGNGAEAQAEWEQIAPDLQGHPAAQEVRCELLMAAKNWTGALDAAATLIQLVPEWPQGWIHRSYVLHELKRTAEARDNLLRVVDKFPGEALIRYNLACYECQLGRLEQAQLWLDKALAFEEAPDLRRAAQEDPDLEPLRRRARQP